MINRLLQDHNKMRTLAYEIRDLLLNPTPSDMQLLAELRWEMASTIMSHLAFEDRAFYSKIEAHPEERVRRLAHRFRAELVETFSAYSQHSKDWTPERIQADWDSYRRAGLGFLKFLLDRADREETELYPFILSGAIDSTTRNLIAMNWAKDAFTMKERIGV